MKLEARAERLTSEAGAVLRREVDERLGLTRWLGETLTDTREESRITHSLRELVRTHLLPLAQGWKDIDDADALREDAALRLAVSDSKSTGPLKQEEGRPQGLASQPTLSRLTAMLAQKGNREALRESRVWLTPEAQGVEARGRAARAGDGGRGWAAGGGARAPGAQRVQRARGLTRVIDDLAQRVGDIFQSEFERAGYTPKVAPIYANALVGMVTQVGQWWAAEGRSFSIDHVARHVAALGWMGLRHLPKDPVSPTARSGTKRRG